MLPQRLTELAEAVADGHTPDWKSAESSATDAIERGLIAKLRAVQSIGSLFTTRSASRGPDAGRIVLPNGATWGALIVREHVGRGRFGDVYRAWDPALDREVALKLVRHGEGADTLETQVVEEGRLMARVRHPNVVTIHGAQRIDGVSGLWMEFVEGRTLAAEVADRGPFESGELIAVGIELCRALAAVHTAGLIHRDVKAQNVLRDRHGRIVLGDFGTGREQDACDAAREGLAGTPAYLAPEIFQRKPATPQSDLYSLGALLFHLATLRYPIEGRSLRQLRDAQTLGQRTPLASLRPDLPSRLTANIEQALDSAPPRRFDSAEAMGRALERCRPRRGSRWLLSSAGIAAAVLIATFGGWAGTPREPGSPTGGGAGVRSEVTSSSPRALELYRQARDLTGAESGGQHPAAVEQLLRDALREDPDFVMARILLGHALFSQPDKRPEAFQHIDLARVSAERGTQVDRYVALAEWHVMQAWSSGDTVRVEHEQQAAAAFEAVLTLHPDHKWALGCLTNLYPRLNRHADAVRVAERMVQLRPTSLTALWRAARASFDAGQIDVARAYAKQASELPEPIDARNSFQAAWVRQFAAHQAWLDGNPVEALRVADRAVDEMMALPKDARHGFAFKVGAVYLTLGRLNDAEAMIGHQRHPPGGETFFLSRVAVQRKDPAKLRTFLARHYPHVEDATNIISVLIEAGLLTRAHRTLALVKQRPEFPQDYIAMAEGQLALASNAPRDAITRFERLMPTLPAGSNFYARALATLAAAYAATGDPPRGMAILEKATEPKRAFLPDNGYRWIELRDQLAQLYRKGGRTREAESVDAELRALMAVADDDHPIKRRLAKIGQIPFKARDWVLVTAAENRTDESLLDGTIEFALERELTTSTFVNVVSRDRIGDALLLMQKSLDTRLDLATSREVALRDGAIRALVTGRIEKVGGSYAVSVDIRKPSDGAIVATVAEPPVPQVEVISAVRRVAFVVRERLGETLPRIDARIEQLPRVTTSSLRALQLYARVKAMQGPEGLFDGRELAAEQLLRSVIAEDPAFAAAHRLLSIAVRLDGERKGASRLPEALQHIERAVASSQSLGEVERIRNEGELHVVRYFMNPPAPEEETHAARAIAACEALLQLNPDDVEALIGCTNFYELTGTPNANVATRLASVRPNSAFWQMRAARALLAANRGRVDLIRPYIRRAQRLPPVSPVAAAAVASARLFDAHEAWLRNRPHDALRIADKFAADSSSYPPAIRSMFARPLWRVYLELGQIDRADELASSVDSAAVKNALTIVAVFREDREALAALLQRQYPNTTEGAGVGTAYIEAGLLPQAREVLKAFNNSTADPRPSGISQYVLLYEGQLALAEGRPDVAIDRLHEMMQRESSRVTDRWIRAARTMAAAWEAKGDAPRAISFLETASHRTIEAVGWGSNYSCEWLQVRDRLARLYRQVGRTSDAAAVESELRALLAVADDDHPIKRRLVARGQDPAAQP